MKPNVNQDDINGKADRREAAFNSNIFFNNMLHEHSVARGLVVYDNSEEKRKKGGKKHPLVCEEYQL